MVKRSAHEHQRGSNVFASAPSETLFTASISEVTPARARVMQLHEDCFWAVLLQDQHVGLVFGADPASSDCLRDFVQTTQSITKKLDQLKNRRSMREGVGVFEMSYHTLRRPGSAGGTDFLCSKAYRFPCVKP
eukprot:s2442_g8.t1